MTTIRTLQGTVNGSIRTMKIGMVALTACAVLACASPNAGYGAVPFIPPTSPFVDVISEIAPSQAAVGDAITVRLEKTALEVFAEQHALSQLIKLSGQLRPTPVPTPPSSLPPKIFFSNGAFPIVAAQSVTTLGNNRYRVVIPSGARTGRLRVEKGNASSYSTGSLTVVQVGYRIQNESQFNIVSVKIDNVERLFFAIPALASPTANPTAISLETTTGSHSVQVTLGPSRNQPVIVYFVDVVAAPINTGAAPALISLTAMTIGEYLVASPAAVVSGSTVSASWQTLVVGPNNTDSVNGFDFTFDTTTQTTTWTHWVGDHPNVTGSGVVIEPTQWPLNPTSMIVQLRSANGTLFSNVAIDLLHKTFLAADGFDYELQ